MKQIPIMATLIGAMSLTSCTKDVYNPEMKVAFPHFFQLKNKHASPPDSHRLFTGFYPKKS